MIQRLLSRRHDRRRLRYPSLTCIPELLPYVDVERLDSAGNADESEKLNWQWRSTSDEPQFLLSGPKPLAGWNMLEIVMEHEHPQAMLRLYFDTGNGFQAEHSVFMPVRQDKITKRICFVPYGTRAIRLDPPPLEGGFTISHLRLVWLTPRFAYDRMARRLCSVHPRYRDKTTREIILALKREAHEDGLSWKKLAIAHYEETFMHRAPESHYRYWLDHIEPMREPDAGQVAVHLSQLESTPLISVLLPIKNTSLERLQDSIESLQVQRYSNWQLCVADASAKASIQTLLERLAAQDSRIQVTRCEADDGAWVNNAALEMARGDYVALLHPADRLAPNTLYHVVDTLSRHPDAQLLYSDADRLDNQGQRYDPHFKPQWNPDLLLAQNYIAHLAVFGKQRLCKLGGFRTGFGTSREYELLLRFTHDLPREDICHIPFVLYHKRDVADALVNVGETGQQALAAYLRTFTPGAEVEPGRTMNSYRVRWPLPEPAPLVSLLIPTRDRIEILRPCVDAILERTDYAPFEVLILDNQSTCKETLAYMAEVEQDPRVRVLRWNHPFNYSAINNFGARQARGSILGLINNDIEPINSDWLCEMVRQVCRSEIGCVGAKLYYPNGTIQHGGVVLGLGGVAGHAHRFFPRRHSGYRDRLNLVQNLSAVTAACLLVRKSVFNEVGGLNEEHLTVAYNDVDLCLKVREAGYRNLWTPYAELYHHESVSRGADNNPKKQARAQRETDYMRRTWGPQLDNDPAYNPNLTLAYEDFSLR